ncbi:MAG: radical SAM protein, partial [Candidatus Omnitrophica bacterium]|nr:radical SAM protein [Candidatus Omnitrophota bacterium]
GPMCLSAIAKQSGHQTRFVRFVPSAVAEIVKEWSPDVIGWSAFSGEFAAMAGLNDALKRSHRFVSIFGGPHPTYFPEALLNHNIDYSVVGEGEVALMKLIDAVGSGSDGSEILNVLTRVKRITELYTLVQDMDSLPIPDYEGYYSACSFLKDFPIKLFMSSRGCPYNCSYCFNHQFHSLYKGKGRIIRQYSVGRLIEEVLFVKKRFPLEFIRFNSDYFVLTRDKWLEEFCEEYPKRAGLPFSCVMNPNNITDEIITMLKGAGLKSICLAIECGNEEDRKNLLTRNIRDETMLDAFGVMHRHNIRSFATVMLGLPGTTFEKDLETLKFARKCAPTAITAPIFQPYPKLRLTDYAISRGHYTPDVGGKFNSVFYGKSLLNFSEDVKRKQKNLSDSFGLLAASPFLSKMTLPFIGHRLVMLPFIALNNLLSMYIYQTKIFPHRLTPKRLWLNLKAAIGYFSRIVKT